MAHGLSGPRFEFAHVAEALAARGFAVIAPEFDDSGSNLRRTVMEHGAGLLGQHTVLRMHELDGCVRYLRGRYGAQLRFGLLGYSIGNAVVRHMLCDWPKVHIAGPSPTGKSAPASPFFDADAQPSEASTNAPCLVIASHADALSPPPLEAARLAGHPDPTPLRLEHVTSVKLPPVAMHAFDVAPRRIHHARYRRPRPEHHAKVLLLPRVPELRGARALRSASAPPSPLLVRFFEQHVGAAWNLGDLFGWARGSST